eukprot:CAMPEP_0197421692 /NCGR_PEP_ID=MMETSP1170-20131217/10728_1 /TAXON_ID=54406 /ORGANISM="Sarcinochrysis sp, Strain CCMP770" /LENGTH=429 /DNA_ID=CAMNT_0042948963 /DNA_START=57 /DNA_END=1346 /DNA_ORIENTATION=+
MKAWHAWGLHKMIRPLRPVVSPIVNLAARRRLEAAVNIADLRLAAEARMHAMCFGYLDSGADDEVTLRRNKDAYLEYAMHYRVLHGLKPETLDTSTTAFGKDLALPIVTCPCAGNKMFHADGERGVFESAKDLGVGYAMSALSTTPVEDVVGDAAPNLKIFQLYLWADDDLVTSVLKKAKAAGFTVLALTVDFTWFGNRERDKRNGFTIPPAFSARQVRDALLAPAWTWDFLSSEAYKYANLDAATPAESLAAFVNKALRPDYSWDDALKLKELWDGPVLIKGIVRPDDAKFAVDHGFGVWVSNHGGRQLDAAPAPVEVVADIRDAVGPDVTIVQDGGIQRGTDIAKAIALGADLVGVGKPYLYGLGAGGKPGVRKALTILRDEFQRAMGLLGVGSIAELKARGRDLVKARGVSPRDAQGARYSVASII